MRRVAAALLLLAATACGRADARPSITVFAAASLQEAFTAQTAAFTEQYGATVTFSFAGSPALAAQIADGAPADVLATADEQTMTAVAGTGRLASAPRIFARNALTIAVAPGNPERISALADLARPGLVVVLAAPAVPAGRYAAAALARAGVRVRPASLEDSVRGVITKVSLGEADAGIGYVTDVRAAAGRVDGVPIPARHNVTASYPIAALSGGRSSATASRFVDFVLAAEGQRVLRRFGFLPPP